MTFASIIICTYNRAHFLERALRSLACQTLDRNCFEVIVVDDGSEDDTADVCSLMKGDLPNLRYLFSETNEGLGVSANKGIRFSHGDYILFTDDDCIARKDWAERLISALERHPVVAGAMASPVTEFVKLCHNISEFHPFIPGRRAGPARFIAGANMGFRRSVLEELKGFREGKIYCPDMEFIIRARLKGYGVYFVPDAVVTHDPERLTLGSIFKYSADHARHTIVLRNQYRSVLRTPFVLRKSVFILAASPVIAFKVTAGIYLRNLRIAKLFWTAPVVYALKLAWCWGAARGLRDWKNRGGACERRYQV